MAFVAFYTILTLGLKETTTGIGVQYCKGFVSESALERRELVPRVISILLITVVKSHSFTKTVAIVQTPRRVLRAVAAMSCYCSCRGHFSSSRHKMLVSQRTKIAGINSFNQA
jgi:hypothetical protein